MAGPPEKLRRISDQSVSGATPSCPNGVSHLNLNDTRSSPGSMIVRRKCVGWQVADAWMIVARVPTPQSPWAYSREIHLPRPPQPHRLPDFRIFVSAVSLLSRVSNSHLKARSSVGEHFPDTEGVGGSNPPVPTIIRVARAPLRSASRAPAARLRPLRVSLAAPTAGRNFPRSAFRRVGIKGRFPLG